MNAETEQKIYGIAPYFIVKDVVESAEFYRDKLGFRFDRYWGEPPGFVMVKRDDVVIMLKSAGGPRPNATLGDEDSAWDAYIWIKDAKALYEEYKGRGVNIVRDICDQMYGCRDFDILDNSGYRLCFGQDLES